MRTSRPRLSACLLAATVATAAAGVAAATSITLDPTRSTIRFTLGATLHTVHGTARMVSGNATLAPATGAMSGEVVVDAASTDTDNDSRDKKMHAKVLEVASHPRIVLRPRHLDGSLPAAGEADVTLTADLELLGGSHRLEIPAGVTCRDGEIEIRATFQIPYVEWGLEDPSAFLLRVEKHVTVEVEAIGSLTTGPAASAGHDAPGG